MNFGETDGLLDLLAAGRNVGHIGRRISSLEQIEKREAGLALIPNSCFKFGHFLTVQLRYWQRKVGKDVHLFEERRVDTTWEVVQGSKVAQTVQI